LLRALDSCDRLLLSVPGLRRQAWMACITAGGPRSPQNAIRRH